MIYLDGSVQPNRPAMCQPNGGRVPTPGQPWAADNGRYSSPDTYTDARYLAWLAARSPEGCLFATAPDVVGDAVSTLALSAPLFAPIRALGYPVALVAQDGLENLSVPWDDFDALFIGGTTRWKVSEAAHSLAREAKRRGKWLHMGRVNSLQRMRVADGMGCDSADGTFVKFGPRVNLPRLQGWLDDLSRQRHLGLKSLSEVPA